MNKMIVANWKMNGSVELVDTFINAIVKSEELILALPHIFIGYASAKRNGFKVAAQDCSVFENYGAHTGEVSAKMLKDSGAEYIILGHSERRSCNEETVDIIYKKMKNAIEAGLKIILCVDENYSKLIDENTESLVKNHIKDIAIAYEPVSAIGTGVVPTTTEISNVLSKIKETYYGIKTLYGGSVNSANSQEILGLESVDGVLIGGASLKIEEIEKILLSLR